MDEKKLAARIRSQADYFLSTARTDFEKFHKALVPVAGLVAVAEGAADPLYAFASHGDAVVEAAARAKVAQLALIVLEKQGAAAVVTVFTEQALRAARWPTRSTSPMTNLTAQAEAAAVADFVAEVTRG